MKKNSILLLCLFFTINIIYADFELGKKYFEEKNFSLAVDELKKEIMENPDNIEAFTLLRKIFYQTTGKEFDFLSKLSIEFDSPAKYLSVANTLIQMEGGIEHAITYAKKAIRLDTKNYKAHLFLGIAYEKLALKQEEMKLNDKAKISFMISKKSYMNVLKTAPKNYQALIALGDFFKRNKKFKAASIWYKKCISYHPEKFKPYLKAGDMNIAVNDMDEAARNYIKAWAIYSKTNSKWAMKEVEKKLIIPLYKSKSDSIHYFVGNKFLEHGKTFNDTTYIKKAMDEFFKAFQINNKNLHAAIGLGDAYRFLHPEEETDTEKATKEVAETEHEEEKKPEMETVPEIEEPKEIRVITANNESIRLHPLPNGRGGKKIGELYKDAEVQVIGQEGNKINCLIDCWIFEPSTKLKE